MSIKPTSQGKTFLPQDSDAEADLPRGVDINSVLTKRLRTASLAIAAGLLLLSALAAYSQNASFATIVGSVLDPQGASVGGATVSATNIETSLVSATQTPPTGSID